MIHKALDAGACWVTFGHGMRERLIEKFDLPDYINVMFYLEVGYPAETPCLPFRSAK